MLSLYLNLMHVLFISYIKQFISLHAMWMSCGGYLIVYGLYLQFSVLSVNRICFLITAIAYFKLYIL